MKTSYRKLLALLFAAVMLLGLLSACTEEQINTTVDIASEVVDLLAEDSTSSETGSAPGSVAASPETETGIPDADGSYTTKEDVSLYLYTYGHLPSNFITKNEAKAAGWQGGSLEPYCPGKCIGGDRFGNREGLLPAASGRTWTECDINTLGASSRGAERIVFSNDGLIYYTGDHYESFELLYGTP